MSIWNKINELIENKDCKQVEELLKNLSNKDKSSPYFLKYSQLLAKNCPKKEEKKILQKGKHIKCPSCGSSISKSPYNNLQLEKLKKGAKQVIFVCNYCGTKINYSPGTIKSLFSDYSIGQEVSIKGKKFKLAGAVKYRGYYKEDGERGSLTYIEWVGYDKNGNIYYLSESRASDSYGVYDEIELSRKIDFPFVIKKNVEDKYFFTSRGTKYIEEINNVKVESVYGDLNKQYKVGEKVKLYKISGKYTFEEEKGDNYLERNLYENIYKKEISDNNSSNDDASIVSLIVAAFILWPFFINCFFPIIIVGTILYFLNVSSGKKLDSNDWVGIVFLSIVIGIILCAFFGGLDGGSSGGGTSYWGSSSFGGGK